MRKTTKLTIKYFAAKIWNLIILGAGILWTIQALFPNAERPYWVTLFLLNALGAYNALVRGPDFDAYMRQKFPEIFAFRGGES